jgi:hypothetical protein
MPRARPCRQARTGHSRRRKQPYPMVAHGKAARELGAGRSQQRREVARAGGRKARGRSGRRPNKARSARTTEASPSPLPGLPIGASEDHPSARRDGSEHAPCGSRWTVPHARVPGPGAATDSHPDTASFLKHRGLRKRNAALVSRTGALFSMVSQLESTSGSPRAGGWHQRHAPRYGMDRRADRDTAPNPGLRGPYQTGAAWT